MLQLQISSLGAVIHEVSIELFFVALLMFHTSLLCGGECGQKKNIYCEV
jgi:hypothetical protein